MSLLEGFPPIAAPSAHTLILGSMPGAASLAAGQYYAHPRNLFWPLVGALLGFDPALPYAERTARLRAHGIALWDVLGCCRRRGSLDSAIEADSMVANDFAAFFAAHPRIARVFFNGSAAEQVFLRQVAPTLDPQRALQFRRLPSTSPANASVTREAKLAAWREILA